MLKVSCSFSRLNYKTTKSRDLRLDAAFKILQVSSAAPKSLTGCSNSVVDVDDVIFSYTKEDHDNTGRVLGTRTTQVFSCSNQGKRFCLKFHSVASEIEKESEGLLLLSNGGVPVPELYFTCVSQTNYLGVAMELLGFTLETIPPFKPPHGGGADWADCWRSCFDALAALHALDFIHGDSGARNFMYSPAQRRWVVIDVATLAPCRGERRTLPSGTCRVELARRHDVAMLYHSLLAQGSRSRNIYRILPAAHRQLAATGASACTGGLLLPCCTCQGFWACDAVCRRIPVPPAYSSADALSPPNLRRVLAVIAGLQYPPKPAAMDAAPTSAPVDATALGPAPAECPPQPAADSQVSDGSCSTPTPPTSMAALAGVAGPTESGGGGGAVVIPTAAATTAESTPPSKLSAKVDEAAPEAAADEAAAPASVAPRQPSEASEHW
jgi:hypothetical protein